MKTQGVAPCVVSRCGEYYSYSRCSVGIKDAFLALFTGIFDVLFEFCIARNVDQWLVLFHEWMNEIYTWFLKVKKINR